MAATGIGGGDLTTGTFVGGLLGTTVLWAVVVGAFLKYVVTEGLTRWQLATGETLLEGVVRRAGPIVVWLFLPYLLLWSFFVAAAQMSASGVALYAMFPVFDDPRIGKIVFGAGAGLVALALVLRGGYRLFERIVRVCIGVMFATVVLTAVLVWPGTDAVLEGLLVPRIPPAGEPLTWTVALIGGIGGTLTVLCYGYWLREEGRTSKDDLRGCRIDIGAGYLVTALFGIAIVIVGSSVRVEGEGTQLIVNLSDRLGVELGPAGRWLFLLGATGTVSSSMLGVWQSVPYLFADCWRLLHRRTGDPVAPRRRHTLAALSRISRAARDRADAWVVLQLPRSAEDLHRERRAVFPLACSGAPDFQWQAKLGGARVSESARDRCSTGRNTRLLFLDCGRELTER